MNHELLNVQAGFRKSRDQIANIHWIIKKAREFQKNIYFCFIDYAKTFDCVDHKKLWKILKEMGISDHLTCLLKTCMQVKKQQLEPDMEQQAGSKLGKEYIKAVYCHPAYLTSMQTSVQFLSRVLLFVTLWTAACQASLSITNSQSLLKFMSIELVMPSNHLILCCPPLLLPSVFPSIFKSDGQSIGVSASASVLSLNIQG